MSEPQPRGFPPEYMPTRDDVITVAAEDLGDDGRGAVERVMGWALPGKSIPWHWCGIWALDVYRRTGVLPPDTPWEDGRGFAMKHLPLIAPSSVERADLAYMRAYQHHEIVERIDRARGLVHCIGGNLRDQVRRVARPVGDYAGFFSISDLVVQP